MIRTRTGSWLATFGIAVISGVAGLVGVGWLANQCVRWYHVSHVEGGAGYFVAELALAGALGGFVIGLVCARRAKRDGDPRFPRGLGLGLTWVLGLVTVATGLAYGLADHPPMIDGKSLVVEVELRTPDEYPLLTESGFTPLVAVLNRGGRSRGSNVAESDAARRDGRRRIVSIVVPLETSSDHKRLWVSWSRGLTMGFSLDVPGQPTGADFTWSGWRRPSDSTRDAAWAATGIDLGFSVRTRVQFEAPPAAPLTQAQAEAAEDGAQATTLASVPVDAPLSAWLPFTRPGIAEARQADVRARIAARPALAAEIRALAVSDNAPEAAEVLSLVTAVPQAAQAWRDGVRAAGQDLVRRLERSITISEAQDPDYEWAAEISIRFSGWLQAARLLRERTGEDSSAVLRSVLKLARQRPDSQALREDVVRVASFYLQEWTGPIVRE
jgi:hypothetical protein